MTDQKKQILYACDVKDHAALDHLEPFQGDLKSLSKESYEKIRKEIVETGFAFPVLVWKSPEEKLFIVGGHQRIRVLKELRDAEGFEVGPVPIVKVQAESLAAAKRRVLQDASTYGRIERQGLYEFMVESGFEPGDIAASFDLPNIHLPDFNAEFFLDGVTGVVEPGEEEQPQKRGSVEFEANEFSSFEHKCPRCGFQFD